MNTQEYAGIRRNTQEYAGIRRNTQEYAATKARKKKHRQLKQQIPRRCKYMVQLAYFFLRCCLHRRPFLCTGTALSPTFAVQLLCFVVVAAAVVVVVVVAAAAAAAAVVAAVRVSYSRASGPQPLTLF